MEQIEKTELERLRRKAAKFDEIEAKLESFYEENSESDLLEIGEWVAGYFGFL